MTEQEIKIYLEAFWKGESSQKQEAALKKYFTEGKISQALEQDRSYFEYLHQEGKKEIANPNFDEQVMDKIHQKKVRKLWYGALKIAAGIAILGGASWWYHTHQTAIPNAATDFTHKSIPPLFHKSDSQESQALAKDAIILLSKGLNKDSSHTEYLNKFKRNLEDIYQEKPSTDIVQ